MKKSERAAQIWPLLSWCAAHRQTMSYDQLSKLIQVPRQGLGQLLEPIQSLCILRDLPALTSVVVGEKSGSPGEGFIAAADVAQAQADVYAYDWLSASTPGPDELEEAVRQLPSNGRSLSDLEAQARAKRARAES